VSGSDPFEFVDSVTSDLSFVARGATLADAFRAAAEALLAATLDNPEDVERALVRPVALEADDLELLLLRLLSELVYLRDAEGLLLRVGELCVEPGPPARLEGALEGESIRPGRHRLAGDVKAVTAHGLRVSRGPRGFEVEVTLDV
jgi:SHS2 domain-containing protein